MTRRGWVLGAVVLAAALGWVVARAPRSAPLHGLWVENDRWPAEENRFYYFLPSGVGLYRLGPVGRNRTQRFDWSTDGDRLRLSFRKSGRAAETQFLIEVDRGSAYLTLLDDPGVEGKRTFTKLHVANTAVIDAGVPSSAAGVEIDDPMAPSTIAGRKWTVRRRYATGGEGFRIYQLADRKYPRVRPNGWYLEGDADEWTTEGFTYGEDAGELRLYFYASPTEATPMRVESGRDGRVLTLERDPRNFLARSRFLDEGKSLPDSVEDLMKGGPR